MDKSMIVIAVSVVSFVVGIIIYLSMPRDLESNLSNIYMYGRREIILVLAIVMMFAGAAGTVFGVSFMTQNSRVAVSQPVTNSSQGFAR